MLGWLLGRKSHRVLTVDQLAADAEWLGYKSASGIAVSRADAVRMSAFFCGLRVLGEGVAQASPRVLNETFDTETQTLRRVQRVDHPAHRLLARRPNGWQTPFQFMEYAVMAAVLDRGFLAVKVRDGRNEVRELLPVPMGCWSVQQEANYSLRFTVSYADKTHGIFDQSEVFYLTGPSLDTLMGADLVSMAREALGLAAVLEKQQARMAGRGGLPSGVLSFDEPLREERIKRLKETWEAKYGANGEGGVAVLDGAAKFHAMTMTSVDSQHLETRRVQIEEVARFLRIQPIMLMQADKAATFASAEQMFRAHVIHTLAPWMRRVEEACNRDLLNNDPHHRVDLDERSLLRGDFKDQAEYYAKALGAGGQRGWMTQNEIRAERGMNPSEDPRANEIPMGAMEPENGTQDG